MSGVIKAAREEFAALLGADVKPTVPDKLGPGGYVGAGDPFIERGDTFGSYRLRLDGVLVFRATNNTTALEKVDDAVEAAIVACLDASWNVVDVGAPQPIRQDGDAVQYLAVLITATKPIGL